MDTHFLVPAIGWGILALAVIALAIYRLSLGSREIDLIHLHSGDMAMTTSQTAFAHKLEQIDRTGKALTAIAVLYGVALLAWFIRDAWMGGSVLPK
ncbi:MAG: hypothetical protein ABI972_03210 [Acidobacteriota bacterium]